MFIPLIQILISILFYDNPQYSRGSSKLRLGEQICVFIIPTLQCVTDFVYTYVCFGFLARLKSSRLFRPYTYKTDPNPLKSLSSLGPFLAQLTF